MSLAVGDISVKILLHGISEIFLLMFSSRTFMVSQVIFKSFIHLEFIYVSGASWCSSFIFLHVAVQISQHYLLKRLFYSILYFCPICWILMHYRHMGLFQGSLFCSISLCVCSYASTRLFWLQWPRKIVWYQVLWSLPLCSFFLILLRLFGVVYGSLYFWKMFVLYLWNMSSVFS